MRVTLLLLCVLAQVAVTSAVEIVLQNGLNGYTGQSEM